jgi:hypothetical protein
MVSVLQSESNPEKRALLKKRISVAKVAMREMLA